MDAQELIRSRKEKNEFFRKHPQSPILPEERATFKGLQYFDPNPDLDLMVQVTEFEDKEDIQMQTSTGDLRAFQRWGEFTFETEGQPVRLTIYFSPHNGYFFLPFTDSTSGKESYGAGRYLDVEPEDGNHFRIDFNLAYSPYCAYSPHYNCPIPPAENRLHVPIRAGEKNYK